MRSFILILIILFTLFTISDAWIPLLPQEATRNNASSTAAENSSTERICKRIRVLTELNKIANNQTATDTQSKLAEARIERIKSKSAAIAAELATLTSNSTLVSECDAINAERSVAQDCKKLERLERLVELARNRTVLDDDIARLPLDDEQTQKLQDKFEDAELKLQELKSNSTLVGLCASDTTLQQDGAIGTQAIDNSGAIARTKNNALARFVPLRTTTVLVFTAMSIIFNSVS